MQERPLVFIAILAVLLFGSGTFIYLGFRSAALDESGDESKSATSGSFGRKPSDLGSDFVSTGRSDALEAMADALELAELERILGARGAIEGEAVLRFDSDAAYRRFLEAAARLGLRILGADPRTRAVRIGFDSVTGLQSILAGLDPGDYDIGANYFVVIPSIPTPGSPDNPGQLLVPFGSRALSWLGISGDILTWGSGVTVAVLDSGIASHLTFRDGQVTLINFLDGSAVPGDLGHGTAVASLVAGNDPAAPGIAPGANLLSYAVTNAEGFSDSFTLATAIYDAMARNVDLINISLGSYGNSLYLESAILAAIESGVLIVAAAGNEGQEGRLTYPAAYDGVISVGAVDALGQHVYYSNSGEDLSISAPGIGVAAAWEGDELVSFSGTSASAPYVTGALAAILSENPGITVAAAQQLLFDYANEAGPPGVDDAYGNGILDVGRIMERNTPGIYDIAIASQTFADPAIPTNNSNPSIDVTVENRGTETLYNVQVQVSSPGILRDFTIPYLAPGEISVLQAPINSTLAQTDGSLAVVATATLTGTNNVDANNRDNRQTTVVNVVTPSGP